MFIQAFSQSIYVVSCKRSVKYLRRKWAWPKYTFCFVLWWLLLLLLLSLAYPFLSPIQFWFRSIWALVTKTEMTIHLSLTSSASTLSLSVSHSMVLFVRVQFLVCTSSFPSKMIFETTLRMIWVGGCEANATANTKVKMLDSKEFLHFSYVHTEQGKGGWGGGEYTTLWEQKREQRSERKSTSIKVITY